MWKILQEVQFSYIWLVENISSTSYLELKRPFSGAETDEQEIEAEQRQKGRAKKGGSNFEQRKINRADQIKVTKAEQSKMYQKND